MVCVVEAEAASRALELLGGEALQGRLGGHGHEDGEVDGAMGQGQDGCAGASDLDAAHDELLVLDARTDARTGAGDGGQCQGNSPSTAQPAQMRARAKSRSCLKPSFLSPTFSAPGCASAVACAERGFQLTMHAQKRSLKLFGGALMLELGPASSIMPHQPTPPRCTSKSHEGAKLSPLSSTLSQIELDLTTSQFQEDGGRLRTGTALMDCLHLVLLYHYFHHSQLRRAAA